MRRVALLAVLLAGCGGNGGEAEPVTERPSTPPASATRHFGYISAVDLEAQTLVFDEAEFLVGREGEEAARADGRLAPGEPLSNDYYIRNRDRSTVTLELSPDVDVLRIQCDGGCREHLPGELAPFAASFALDEPAGLDAPYRGRHSQYWLTLRRGVVIKIDEQYLP